jgi:hypothetical protein
MLIKPGLSEVQSSVRSHTGFGVRGPDSSPDSSTYEPCGITSLSFGFFICKKGIIIAAPKGL